MSNDLADDLERSLAAVRAAKRANIARNPTRSVAVVLAEKVDAVTKVTELEQRDRPGKHVEHVYCLRFGNGPVKFGYSANLGARLRVMGASHWEPVTMLGATPGDRVVESSIHATFALERIEGTREWYRPTKEVLDFAQRMVDRRLLPEVQASIDLYAPMPVEQVFAGTHGQVCPVCGSGDRGTAR